MRKKKGDKVKAGQVIGLTGRTGRATTEHLHFEVSFGGKRLDPAIIFDHSNHKLKAVTLHLTKGKGVKSVASIGLNIAGQKFEAASSGNGPVDAAIHALKKVITKEMNLKEFTIQAIDKGSDDVGKVNMQVEYDGHVYYGFGADTDIVTASVEAYIDCINKFKVR